MITAARMMDVIRRLSPKCREAARMISDAADQRRPALDRIGLFLHVLICTPCRRYQQSVKILKRKMKQIATYSLRDLAQSMPPEARARIRRLLEEAASGDASSS